MVNSPAYSAYGIGAAGTYLNYTQAFLFSEFYMNTIEAQIWSE